MKGRFRIGVVIAVVSWLLVGAAFALLLLAKIGGIGHDFFHLQDAAVGLAYPALGLLILRQRSSHPIGWILLAAGVSGALGVFGEEYVTYGYEFRPGSLPFVAVVGWLGTWTWTFFFTLLPVLLLLFPNGRLVSTRWRLALAIALVPVVAFPITLAWTTWGAPLGLLAESDTGPGMEGAAGWAFGICLLLFGIALISSVVSLALRLRRSRGPARQQMKVFLAFAVFGVVLVGLSQVETPVREALGVAAFLLVPAGITAAILRYRLYDIDRIVSRTVSYTMITAALAMVFLGLVFTLRTLLPAESELAVAASTLAVAALFNPLRRRVQAAVDHRFNRARYDAEHTVETFAHGLRTQVDVADLGYRLKDVVATTVQPTRVSLWLRDDQ